MNRHERGVELKVGLFVFLGLVAVGALVVQFGRLGEGFKTYYPLKVRFNDASGLLKGSEVLLAGASIGKVAGGPRMTSEGNGVDVPLKIYDYIKIPENSKFTVGSSGLLGDRFVNVTLQPGERKSSLRLTVILPACERLVWMILPERAAPWWPICGEPCRKSTSRWTGLVRRPCLLATWKTLRPVCNT